MTTTPTPRTDAACDFTAPEKMLAESKKLEHELTEANARYRTLNGNMEVTIKRCMTVEAERDELKATLHDLENDRKGVILESIMQAKEKNQCICNLCPKAACEMRLFRERALAAEAACAEMRSILEIAALDTDCFHHHAVHDKARALLANECPGQGWHSPEEREKAQKHINSQRERIRYLEGATNHAEGTPLTRACLRIAELERQLATLRKLFPEILSALESGGCTEDVSLEFLQHIPEEVRLVVLGLKQQLAEARKDGERLEKVRLISVDYCGAVYLGPSEYDVDSLEKFREAIDNAKGDK